MLALRPETSTQQLKTKIHILHHEIHAPLSRSFKRIEASPPMTNDKANNDTLLFFQFLPFFTYFALRKKKPVAMRFHTEIKTA